MSFMSCRHAFKRVLRRIAAPLLMQPLTALTALMAVGQAAADPLRPGEVMLDYYGHGAVLVTAPGGERVMFDRWSGRADADGTPLLHDFPAGTADHSLSTAAAPASWEGARIRVTGSGAGEGSLYLVEAGGMRIVVWGRAPAGTSVPAAALARYGRPDVMVLPADVMDEVSASLRPAIVVPVRYRIDGLTGAAAQLPHAEAVFASRPYRTRLVKPRLTLTPEWMDGFERHIQFFDSHYVK